MSEGRSILRRARKAEIREGDHEKGKETNLGELHHVRFTNLEEENMERVGA